MLVIVGAIPICYFHDIARASVVHSRFASCMVRVVLHNWPVRSTARASVILHMLTTFTTIPLRNIGKCVASMMIFPA